MFKKKISIKTPDQIHNIREAGKYLTELLWLLREMCKPGITTMELEVFAEKFLLSHNLVWAFKWYNWYPSNLCTSNNDCVVHGIPSDEMLIEWDLLKVDCGVTYKWGIADAAFSIIIWWDDQNPEWARLIQATKYALDQGIKVIKPWVVGKTFGKRMQTLLSEKDISIIRHLTWHGVWSDVHEYPHIYNRPQNSMKKWRFEEGMVCAIEPITALTSTEYIEKWSNKRNLYTDGGDLGAQWEYTLVVTKGGVEILAGLQ